ncbi:hypothetical protein ACH35V_14970 [Actinomadura sp. 1N219]|uniref:hypothetical protein n=1 Tax=Actinomadura sp. 1N219 TaxID=3375152 RepID=UPI00378F0B5A
MGDDASGNPEPERERNASGDRPEGLTGRPVTPDSRPQPSEGPDVYLDVPQLKVDEISLEVENLDAHVSLVAQVLDLLRLNVGADVFLGKVKLDIKGVEAQAHLEVRLDNVAVIVDRVLTTLDRNPEILQHIGRGVETAVRDIGTGTGTAVGEVGRGAKGAVQDVGRGAGGAVESVGEGTGGAVRDVGRGAGGAVQDVGRGAGGAVQDVGQGAGGAVQDVGQGAGGAVQDVGQGAGGAVQDVGKGAGKAAQDVGAGTGRAAESTGHAAENAGRGAGGAAESAGRAAENAGESASEAVNGTGDEDDTHEAKSDSEESTDLQTALHGTEESVRDLGRALLRMISQQPAHPKRSRPTMTHDGLPDAERRRTADILFTAKVKADELRFDVAPEVSVVFTGNASGDSTSGSDRTNLPDKVEENTTYRDIEIHYAIAAKLDAPDSP